MEKDNECRSCEFFEQGKYNSFCGNKQQTNKDRKRYCYYTHSCSLWVKGISKSRLAYMRRDYQSLAVHEETRSRIRVFFDKLGKKLK